MLASAPGSGHAPGQGEPARLKAGLVLLALAERRGREFRDRPRELIAEGRASGEVAR
jgi:hypothetical protein